MTYAELAVTTNFSFLRGASHPKELVERAVELGLAAIGIADRNSLAGVVRAHEAWKKLGPDTPLKLLIGARLVFRDGTPDILAYPKDRKAYARLCRLLSIGKLRAPKGECRLDYADFVAHGEGQVVVALPPEGPQDFVARIAADFAGRAYLAAHHLYRGDDARRLNEAYRSGEF